MNNEELILAIQKKHDSMRDFFLQHFVPRSHLAYRTKNLMEGTTDQLAYVLAWLNDLERKEYKELKTAYNLVDADTWEWYRLHELETMQEQIILKKAQHAAKMRWSKRPDLLNKTFTFNGKVKKNVR